MRSGHLFINYESYRWHSGRPTGEVLVLPIGVTMTVISVFHRMLHLHAVVVLAFAVWGVASHASGGRAYHCFYVTDSRKINVHTGIVTCNAHLQFYGELYYSVEQRGPDFLIGAHRRIHRMAQEYASPPDFG